MTIPAGIPVTWILLQIAVVGAFSIYTYRDGMLTGAGSTTAFIMGAVIVLSTNLLWLLLLFTLLALASLTTKFGWEEKQERSLAEKKGGRRGPRNVLANGLPSAAMAVLAPFTLGGSASPAAIAFACGVAVSAADTVASEIGSLSDEVVLLTTLKPVPPGTDGGVSAKGQLAALGGAAVTAAAAVVFLGILEPLVLGVGTFPLAWGAVLIVVAMGFLGCQVDSLLGATLEVGDLVTKQEVNLVSIAVGTVLGFILAITFY